MRISDVHFVKHRHRLNPETEIPAIPVTGMTKATKQIDKFKQAARDLETDDDEKRFNEKLEKIARQKPPKHQKGNSDDD